MKFMMKNSVYILVILIIIFVVLIPAVFWFAKESPESKNIIGEEVDSTKAESSAPENATTSWQILNEEIATESKSKPETEETAPENLYAQVTPQTLDFRYQIGNPNCPRIIGITRVAKTGSGNVIGWRIKGAVPRWLEIKNSGFIGENVPVYFTCILDNNEPQTLSVSLQFVLFDEYGKVTNKPAILRVTGYISGE